MCYFIKLRECFYLNLYQHATKKKAPDTRAIDTVFNGECLYIFHN